MLTPYAFPGQTLEEDMTRTPRQWIEAAIDQYERGKISEGAFAAALKLLLAGAYEKVLEYRSEYDRDPTPELAGPRSWAYVMQGNALSAKAKAMTGDEAERLFLEAEIQVPIGAWDQAEHGRSAEQLGQRACR